jgi:hypothetical protein
MSGRKRKEKENDGTLLSCTSSFGTKVVFTERVLKHVKERHPEVFDLPNLYAHIRRTIENPDFVAKGRTDEHVALRRISDTHSFLAVFYIEGSRIKTIFITSKPESFKRRGIIWPK